MPWLLSILQCIILICRTEDRLLNQHEDFASFRVCETIIGENNFASLRSPASPSPEFPAGWREKDTESHPFAYPRGPQIAAFMYNEFSP